MQKNKFCLQVTVESDSISEVMKDANSFVKEQSEKGNDSAVVFCMQLNESEGKKWLW